MCGLYTHQMMLQCRPCRVGSLRSELLQCQSRLPQAPHILRRHRQNLYLQRQMLRLARCYQCLLSRYHQRPLLLTIL